MIDLAFDKLKDKISKQEQKQNISINNNYTYNLSINSLEDSINKVHELMQLFKKLKTSNQKSVM